jgi:hypothetical protein
VNWAFTGGERVSSAWGATVTTTGTTVSAHNAAYNGSLGAGTSTTFGFIGTGASSTPALTCATR